MSHGLNALGPSLAFKPTRHTRIDNVPLFGTTNAGPNLQLFVILSTVLGPKEEGESETRLATQSLKPGFLEGRTVPTQFVT
jgi:hypothetical protein